MAAESDQSEVEPVHQLRVSTRRATAVLQLFEAMLPRNRRRWFEKRLKQIRRTAGIARDLDVLVTRLKAACENDSSPGCAALIDRAVAARQDAQPAICEMYLECSNDGFKRRLKKLSAKTRWRSKDAERAIVSRGCTAWICALWRWNFSPRPRPI